ncbi:MAG: 50S ribosomal protein L21 [Bacteroidota bacterium]
MYAIVEIAGQQFKVQKDDEIFVHRLDSEPGKKVEFSEVLLIDNSGKISVGKPFVEGSNITARVIGHVRGDKVIVFHKKRRKGYQKSTGHRQDFTKIQIENIALKAAADS